MKMKQKLIAGAIALSACAGLSAPAAYAEVAASVGASNMYYWRGMDLLGGAALTADINVNGSGFFAGIWTSSGDAANGTEYDLYAGYAGSVGDFTYGVSVISYVYPTVGEDEESGLGPVKPGEYVEIVPSIGYGPFKVTYYDAVVADHPPLADEDYSYMTAELNFAKFALKYGQHMSDEGAIDGFAHIDLTYKFNEKLSFTLGQTVDDADGFATDETNFVVNLSLPIL